jgi:hypothetical protein
LEGRRHILFDHRPASTVQSVAEAIGARRLLGRESSIAFQILASVKVFFFQNGATRPLHQLMHPASVKGYPNHHCQPRAGACFAMEGMLVRSSSVPSTELK